MSAFTLSDLERIIAARAGASEDQSYTAKLAAKGINKATEKFGEEAVEAVRERAPDLVIMDVRMPGMSSLEAFAQMRELEPKLPVIIMTAYGTLDTARRAMDLGAFDYLATQLQFEPYMSQFTEEQLSYFYGFPAWAVA